MGVAVDYFDPAALVGMFVKVHLGPATYSVKLLAPMQSLNKALLEGKP